MYIANIWNDGLAIHTLIRQGPLDNDLKAMIAEAVDTKVNLANQSESKYTDKQCHAYVDIRSPRSLGVPKAMPKLRAHAPPEAPVQITSGVDGDNPLFIVEETAGMFTPGNQLSKAADRRSREPGARDSRQSRVGRPGRGDAADDGRVGRSDLCLLRCG